MIKYKIYKIYNNQWRLQYQLDGKRIRRNFKIKRDALNYIHEVQKNYSSSNSNYSTIHKCVEILKEIYPQSSFFKTQRVYKSFLDAYGNYKPAQVTTSVMREYLDNYRTEHNLSDKSISNYKCCLNALFSFLIKERVIIESPLESIKYYPYKPSKKVLDDKYFEALYLYSPYFLYRVIWLEYHTKLSRKAVLELKWTDDFSKFDDKIKTFINLLPRRCEYVLVNRKGTKIDRNLVRKRIRDFEVRFTSLQSY